MAVPSIPHPAAAQVYAGEWFESFNNLVDQAKALAFAVLGLVVVIGVLTALHVSKGAIVKVVMAGLTGAVAIWLATNADENAERTDTEFTGGGSNGAPATPLVPGQPVRLVPAVFTGGDESSGGSAFPGGPEQPVRLVRTAFTGGDETGGVLEFLRDPHQLGRSAPAAFVGGAEAGDASAFLHGPGQLDRLARTAFTGRDESSGGSAFLHGPAEPGWLAVPAVFADGVARTAVSALDLGPAVPGAVVPTAGAGAHAVLSPEPRGIVGGSRTGS